MKKVFLFFILLFCFTSILTVEAKTVLSSDINNRSYIIGKHLFDKNSENYTDIYKGALETKHLMLASKTIESNNVDDMIIYYKNIYGEWINGATLEKIDNIPSSFDIDYIDGQELPFNIYLHYYTCKNMLDCKEFEFKEEQISGNDYTPNFITTPEGYYGVDTYDYYDLNGTKLGSGVVGVDSINVDDDIIINIVYEPYSAYKTIASPVIPTDLKYEYIKNDYRKIVISEMIKYATFEWEPNENMCVEWQDEDLKNFDVSICYQKGIKYYGVPYSQAGSSFDLFKNHLDDNNKFSPSIEPFEIENGINKYAYENITGMHCSASMSFAYQTIFDGFEYGPLPKPSNDVNSARFGILKFNGNLKPLGGDYLSYDLFNKYSKEEIYYAYSNSKPADILFLWHNNNVGHTKMILDVNTKYQDDNNEIIDEKLSTITTIEQTNDLTNICLDNKNQLDSYLNLCKTKNNVVMSTWKILTSTFEEFYNQKELIGENTYRGPSGYMPITLNYFESDNHIKTAVITLDKENNETSINNNGLQGMIESNFPINYYKITIENNDGMIVREIYQDSKTPLNIKQIELSQFNDKLGLLSFEPLPSAKYTLKIEVGIARGSVNLFTLNFIKK